MGGTCCVSVNNIIKTLDLFYMEGVMRELN